MSKPAINAPDLGLKVRCNLLHILIFALHFLTHERVSLILSISKFIESMAPFFLRQLLLHVDLVPDVLNLARAGILLGKQPVHQVRHFDLELVLHVVLDALDYVAELVSVLEVGHLESAQTILIATLFVIDKLHLLLEAHHFGLDPLEDFVEEHRGGIALAIYQLVTLLRLP